MKTANLEATFSEVYDEKGEAGGNELVLTSEATASTIRSAVSRGLRDILKSPELKRKRITTITLRINLSNTAAV